MKDLLDGKMIFKRNKSATMVLVAISTIVAFYAVIVFLSIRIVPVENKEIILILIGNLSSAFMLIVGYYFGNSVKQEKNGGENVRDN